LFEIKTEEKNPLKMSRKKTVKMLSYLHSKFAIRTWRQSNKENKKS